jgi:hypothetical protein
VEIYRRNAMLKIDAKNIADLVRIVISLQSSPTQTLSLKLSIKPVDRRKDRAPTAPQPLTSGAAKTEPFTRLAQFGKASSTAPTSAIEGGQQVLCDFSMDFGLGRDAWFR